MVPIFNPNLGEMIPIWILHMDVSKKNGTQQPWVFLLKMIILGCFGGTTVFFFSWQSFGDFRPNGIPEVQALLKGLDVFF